MRTLIRKNSVKLIAKDINDTENVLKVALSLIELIDGKSKDTYAMQCGFGISEVEISFVDYYRHDIKEWLSIAKL